MQQSPQAASRGREDWFDPDCVVDWIQRQEGRAVERRRHFAIVRSLVPQKKEASFRYLNVGAGDGALDEVLLSHFTGAVSVVLDGSTVMIENAQKRLTAFGKRAQTAEANLSSPDWLEAVEGPFDAVVSTIALHNLRDPLRLRALYGEIFQLLGEGGCFLNMDYVRPASPVLGGLASWAGADADAGYTVGAIARPRQAANVSGDGGGGARRGGGFPGALEEHLVWLREAGFAPVDCFWKEFQLALFGGFKGSVRLPEQS